MLGRLSLDLVVHTYAFTRKFGRPGTTGQSYNLRYPQAGNAVHEPGTTGHT